MVGDEHSTLLPDVPTIFEAAEIDEESAFWIRFRAGIAEIGRSLITTPGIPEDRLEYLRAAVDAVLTNPEFIKEAEKRGLPIEYANAEKLDQTIDFVFGDLPEEQLSAIREVLLNKYF